MRVLYYSQTTSKSAALHYFTGSQAHNIAVRKLGRQRGLKINEYGVFKFADRVAGETEASVYEALGLSFIPPELLENRGEIEASRKNSLPDLIEVKDLKGDLHVHTRASDGRLINEREPYQVDMEKIIAGAFERGCFLELNSNPKRLDLIDVYCQIAKDRGVLIVINTDAHNTKDFDNLRFGIGQGRRGWLTKKDVVNTRPLGELRRLLKGTMG